MKTNIDLGLIILRISIGGLMLFHGIAKLEGLTFIKEALAGKGLPEILSYGVYITEIVAPVLIIIGYRTRIASVVFILGMIMAVYLVHPDDIFSLSGTGAWAIETIGLFTFGALTLFFTGAGRYAFSFKNKWD
jgi:putative oxidoreductase